MWTFRLLVTLVSLVAVAVSLVVSLTSADGGGLTSDGWVGENVPFIAVVLVLTAVPFVLYLLFVSSEAATILVGLALAVPVVGVFAFSAGRMRHDGGAGAGGPILWLGLPTVALAYLVVLGGIAADRAQRRPPLS